MLQKREADGASEQTMFHGSSLAGVVSIAKHGAIIRSRNAEQYEVEFYGSPAGVAAETGLTMMALDKQYSSPDASGLQHILLCKKLSLLCGRQETLINGGSRGSTQFEPSGEEFDSGIDNPNRPHRILMWGSTLSTHVRPVYVVSLRALVEVYYDPENVADGVDEFLSKHQEILDEKETILDEEALYT